MGNKPVFFINEKIFFLKKNNNNKNHRKKIFQPCSVLNNIAFFSQHPSFAQSRDIFFLSLFSSSLTDLLTPLWRRTRKKKNALQAVLQLSPSYSASSPYFLFSFFSFQIIFCWKSQKSLSIQRLGQCWQDIMGLESPF